MIRTTYPPSHTSNGLRVMSALTERERADIAAALETGELVGILSAPANCYTGAEIVAAITPELADRLIGAQRTDVVDELRDNLAEAREELRNARQIVREVMAEKQPGDFLDRIMHAMDDVHQPLDLVAKNVEELS